MSATTKTADPGDDQDKSRRDFLYIMTGTLAVAGAAAAIWPMIDSMNPAADVLALSTVEIDLKPIAPGQRITVDWRGQPVFIVRRTAKMIARAKKDDKNPNLIDPEPDSVRVQKPEWLIVIGICTHLGCIPLGQKKNDPRGPWGGWYCPCHGSEYDIAGRVRHGPAPENLWLMPYEFTEGGQKVVLGKVDPKSGWFKFSGKRGGLYKA